MKFSARILATALLATSCVFWAGCFPPSRGQTAEEMETHFIAGQKRVNAMDYPRAIQSFEKALEVNPRSAAAHWELGCIYLQYEKDPAAAIYHFQKYLTLSPGAQDAELVKQHIEGCKMELAKHVTLGPLVQGQQREWERMLAENKRLQETTNRLGQEIAQMRFNLATNQTQVANSATGSRRPAETRENRSGQPPGERNVISYNAQSITGQRGRTYVVQVGDTMHSIARKQGVTFSSLKAANPGIDPNRIRPGQTIYLPSSR